MDDEKRKEEERKKRLERERAKQRVKQSLELKQEKKRRSLHDKHRDRRKKDCMIGMPFIIAFHGDPSMNFYCADYPKTYELIPKTERYPNMAPFARLAQYLAHHVTSINAKVLIYKAGPVMQTCANCGRQTDVIYCCRLHNKEYLCFKCYQDFTNGGRVVTQ